MSEDNTVFVKGLPVNHRLSAEKFLSEIIALAKDGYVLSKHHNSIKGRPNFIGFPSCSMVKEGTETPKSVEPVEETSTEEPILDTKEEQVATYVVEGDKEPETINQVEVIEILTKKKELLDKAEELGIEVPEDIKAPKAIQKFLLENVAGKE